MRLSVIYQAWLHFKPNAYLLSSSAYSYCSGIETHLSISSWWFHSGNIPSNPCFCSELGVCNSDIKCIWADYNKSCGTSVLRSACASTQSDQSSLIACSFYSSCRTESMYRLIWVFAGHTGLIIRFVVRWFTCLFAINIKVYFSTNWLQRVAFFHPRWESSIVDKRVDS